MHETERALARWERLTLNIFLPKSEGKRASIHAALSLASSPPSLPRHLQEIQAFFASSFTHTHTQRVPKAKFGHPLQVLRVLACIQVAVLLAYGIHGNPAAFGEVFRLQQFSVNSEQKNQNFTWRNLRFVKPFFGTHRRRLVEISSSDCQLQALHHQEVLLQPYIDSETTKL